MAIPDFQTLILPLLRSSTDGEIRSIGSVVDSLAREIKLTDEGLRQLLPSGRQATFRNRVA
jgi:restriction system protein